MPTIHRGVVRLGLIVIIAAAAAGLAAPVTAHEAEHVGPYTIEIGWRDEPTYVSQPNAVQVTIKDGSNKPVTDLPTDALTVVVSTNGQSSSALTFEPAFDAEEGEGPLGEYDAAIVPTTPGDYEFHITGTIHGQAVDITSRSGDQTFDPVKGSDDLEFPNKQPSLGEVATRLDRIDSRIAALQSAAPGQGNALDVANAAQAAANDARVVGDRALLVGAILGGAGVVFGLSALLAARSTMARSRRGS